MVSMNSKQPSLYCNSLSAVATVGKSYTESDLCNIAYIASYSYNISINFFQFCIMTITVFYCSINIDSTS